MGRMLPKINHKHCNCLYFPLLFEALMVPLKKKKEKKKEREREREEDHNNFSFSLCSFL